MIIELLNYGFMNLPNSPVKRVYGLCGLSIRQPRI